MRKKPSIGKKYLENFWAYKIHTKKKLGLGNSNMWYWYELLGIGLATYVLIYLVKRYIFRDFDDTE